MSDWTARRRSERRSHWISILAALITALHRSTSSPMYRDVFSTEPPKISADNFLRRSCNSGWRSASFTSALTVSTMSPGCLGRRHDTVPRDCLETRQRLRDRRYVRQGRKTLGRSNREQSRACRLRPRQRDAEIVEHHVDVARDQALQGRRRPAIGNVTQLDLGHQLKQLGGKMRGRSIALRGGRDLVGIFLQVFDQLAQVRCLDVVRIDDQRVRHLGHHNDRFEFGRIERQLRIEALVDHKRRRRRGEQCVAVRCRAIGRLGADVSGGTGAVLDDDRLAPLARQPFRDQPRHGVSRSSGRERHDDFYSAVGIAVGPCRARKAIPTARQSARAIAVRPAKTRSRLNTSRMSSSLPTVCRA